MELNGKVAVAVGGASGMARAAAEQFAAKGAQVVICDLPTSKGAEAAGAIGNGAVFRPIDVLDFEATERVLEDIVREFGAIHVVVNTAGGGLGRRTISKDGPLPLDEFRKTVDLNLIATFNVSRLAAWHMSKNEPNEDGERGVIINTSSIAAFEGQIGQVAYSAAKAGIAGMTLTMARDLGGVGVRVNTIAPSLFATGLTEGIPDEWALALTKDAAFPKRMGRPEEYGRLAVAIVENAMLNGGTIRLDGGQRFAPK